ncbi:MAG: hypothetical protein V4515_14445 [Chloroflexota bacterium]
MSFQRKPKKITFPEDHELHGLEVLTRRPSVGAIEAVTQIRGETEGDVAAQVNGVIDSLFAPALIWWNYVDEGGNPVPATAEGLRAIDVEALLYILNGWVGDTADVPAEVGKESASGQPSPARLMDGVPALTDQGLSAALANLPMHSAS